MKRFKVPRLDLNECKIKESNMWSIEELAEWDAMLKICKSRLDAPYKENARRFEQYTIQMEPSRHIKTAMVKAYSPQAVTNAWLKLVEMLASFKLIKDHNHVRMFDNASAPGAFIMGANYWVTTVMNNKLDWMASSLISKSDNSALGDSYGLAKLHPQRFTTTGTPFNGDTTFVPYLRYMAKHYKKAFKFYSSDLGMAIGEGEYNMQEAINAKGNLGQILMGLEVLDDKGTFLIKQYTHLSSFTISLIAIVAASFDNTYIVKPVTSKPDNSEEYIVAEGFRGTPQVLLDVMYEKLEQKWDADNMARDFTTPLIPLDCLTDEFIHVIKTSAKMLIESQCAKIDANLAEYENMVKNNMSRPSTAFTKKHIDPFVSSWLKLAKFKKMYKESYIRVNAPRWSSRTNRGRQEHAQTK